MVADDPESSADLDGHANTADQIKSWQFDSANNLWLVNGKIFSPNGGTGPILVQENVIWDQGANNGKGVNSQQKEKFGTLQKETESLYGQVNITFEVSYTNGVITWGESGPASISGAKRGSLNVLVTDSLDYSITRGRTDVAISGKPAGMMFTFLSINNAYRWTLSHEFTHHFLGDTQGKGGFFANLIRDTYINHFVIPNIKDYGKTLRSNAASPCFTGGNCQ